MCNVVNTNQQIQLRSFLYDSIKPEPIWTIREDITKGLRMALRLTGRDPDLGEWLQEVGFGEPDPYHFTGDFECLFDSISHRVDRLQGISADDQTIVLISEASFRALYHIVNKAMIVASPGNGTPIEEAKASLREWEERFERGEDPAGVYRLVIHGFDIACRVAGRGATYIQYLAPRVLDRLDLLEVQGWCRDALCAMTIEPADLSDHERAALACAYHLCRAYGDLERELRLAKRPCSDDNGELITGQRGRAA